MTGAVGREELRGLFLFEALTDEHAGVAHEMPAGPELNDSRDRRGLI